MSNAHCVSGNGYDLWHGRCEDVLPDLDPVDALITDPPYGINMSNRMAANNACKFDGKYEFKEWDRQHPSKAVFDLMLSKVKPGGVAIIWGGNYFSDILPPSMGWLVWDKMQREWSWADGELAWTNRAKALRIFSHPRSSPSETRWHPTQKPLALMSWCLDIADRPAVVLDPFMGAGTTGVACRMAGVQFVGIEVDGEYFNMARRRIERAVIQERLAL